MEMHKPINVIEANGVIKQFGDQMVLDGTDFEMPAGSIYGITGANGSGKSVFLRILTGLIHPNAGSVMIFGDSIGGTVEFPRSTGALIDQAGFIKNLSGFSNLKLLADINKKIGPAQINECLRFVGINPNNRRPVGTYSTGMRQRLALAQAMMEEPDLLILDEPANGLDFGGQSEIFTLLAEFRKLGKSILLTSHSRDELRLLCDKVFMLTGGKLQPMVMEAMA